MTDLSGNRPKRDGTADLLKGFAVLFMIQVHLMEQFATPDTYNSVIGKASMFLGGPLCAPVFLAVMGYFLASSERSMKYFIKRGAFLFLGGILLNMARSANLLIQILIGKIDLDPLFFILGADILTLAGLSLVLIGFLRLIFKDKMLFYFLSALIVAALSPFINQVGLTGTIPVYMLAFFWGTLDWSYFPVFPWFAYVLVGFAFRIFLRNSSIAGKIDVKTHIFYFIPLFIGVVITIPWAAGITRNLEGPDGYYHHGILFFAWAVLFMVAYLVVLKIVDLSMGANRIFIGIKWIGQRVTILYVIQWLIIGNLATWLFRSQNLFQFMAWLVIVTFTTVITGVAYEKIRIRFFRNA